MGDYGYIVIARLLQERQVILWNCFYPDTISFWEDDQKHLD